MPLSIDQVASNKASVTFPYAGDTLTVVYYPSRISDKMLRSLSKTDTNNVDGVLDGLDSMNEMLSKIIKSWDLYKDPKQTIMYPIDAESLSELPLGFKREVFMKIMEDMNPNTIAAQIQK